MVMVGVMLLQPTHPYTPHCNGDRCDAECGDMHPPARVEDEGRGAGQEGRQRAQH
jgi:hypothetical protein